MRLKKDAVRPWSSSSSRRISITLGDLTTTTLNIGSATLASVTGAQGAIDTIEGMAETLFDPQDLVNGFINQPLWSNSQQTCINIWPFGNQCVTWWNINAGITSATQLWELARRTHL